MPSGSSDPVRAPEARERDAPVPPRVPDQAILREEFDIEFGSRWYEVIQAACLAFVDDDQERFGVARRLLAESRSAKAQHGDRFLAELAKPSPAPLEEELDPFNREYPALLVGAARAYHLGLDQPLTAIEREFDRRAEREAIRKRTPPRALANAVRILRGMTRAIVFDTEPG